MEQRWIPVAEGLPEESLNSVIGWDTYRERCCFVHYTGGRFILGDDTDSVNITAWMPLPEPYRKGEPPKQTNADRIRSMTDEELAEMLSTVSQNCVVYLSGRINCRHSNCDTSCKNNIKKWLRQKVRDSMERLTKTYSDGTHGAADNLPCGENSYEYKGLLLEALGKYEDAEEQGRVLPAPLDGVERFSLDGGKTIWQRVYEADMPEEGAAMRENEAIEVLKDFGKQVSVKADGAYQSTIGKKACDVAIKALEEVQQYRKRGVTLESALNNMCDLAAAENLIEEYRAIGTPEECRAAMEKQPVFNMDKVVEQLEKKIQTHKHVIEYEKKNGTITEEFQQRKAVEVLEGAIDIVKAGGVDGN